MRISDWSSDVCSSDLAVAQDLPQMLDVPDPVDDDHHYEAQHGADAGGFRGRGDAAVEGIDDAGDDDQEGYHARQQFQLFSQRIATIEVDQPLAAFPA